MKKINFITRILLTIAIGLAVFCLPAKIVSAETGQSLLLKQILEIQDKIFRAQVKMAVLNGVEKIPADFSFKNNLKFEDYNLEVAYMQLIFRSEGVYCNSCWVTGFFGQGTRQALIAFQQKYAKEILASQGLIKANALVDGFTRDKLNSILGRDIFLPAVAGASDISEPAKQNSGNQSQIEACVPAAPGMPRLLFPKNNQPNLPLSLTFSWTPPLNWGFGCPDEKKYFFQLDDNPDFSSPLVETFITFPQTSYFVFPGIMNPNNIYHWRLRAENGFKGGYTAGSFGVSFLPGLDLRVGGSKGPLTVNYNNFVNLSWISSQAKNCEASGDWSGKKPLSGSEKIEGLTSSKIFKIVCSGQGGSTEDSVEVEVLPMPTLELEAKVAFDQQDWQDAISGIKPLKGVDVNMAVSGNTAGSIDYKIDCNADGVWDKVLSGEIEDTKIIIDACDYSVLGTHRLLARVERAGMSAEKSMEISVYESPTLDWEVVSIERNPKTGLKSGDKVSYIAKVINKGPASSQEFRYLLFSDYVAQVSGRLPGLKTGEIATVIYQTVFPVSPKIIEFRLDPNNEVVEYSKTNNSLSVSSDK